jgi:spore coat polysaccharide biosynthesis protein SpsF
MKIGIIVQCRMTSSRLPGKVLYSVRGKPMIQYTLESLARCRRGQVVVATSDHVSDFPIVEFCRESGISYHVGPLSAVATRFAEAVAAFGFDCFARISGDSPLIDHRLVDMAIDRFIEFGCLMSTNVKVRTFPKGQSVEVLDARTFLRGVERIVSPDDQEHVTPWFYANLDAADIVNFESGGAYGEVQQSVDTAEDLAWFERTVAGMTRPHWEYTYVDLLPKEAVHGR